MEHVCEHATTCACTNTLPLPSFVTNERPAAELFWLPVGICGQRVHNALPYQGGAGTALGTGYFREPGQWTARLPWKNNQPLLSAPAEAPPSFLNCWLESNTLEHSANAGERESCQGYYSTSFFFSALISSEAEHISNCACQIWI